MLLPRPYPDELIGSLLVRSSRRLGVTITQLTRLAGIAPPEKPSFVVPGYLARLSDLAGVSAEELLIKHTVFPLIALTSDSVEVKRLRAASLEKDWLCCFAAYRAQFPRHPGHVSELRFCVACAANDAVQFGETYWHRTHNLPGVLTCPEHLSRLTATSTFLLSSITNKSSALPDTAHGVRLEHYPPRLLLRHLSNVATDAMAHGSSSWVDCSDEYAAALRFRGYDAIDRRDVRLQLMHDCETTYGKPLLERLELPLSTPLAQSWVVKLIQGKQLRRQAVLAHVLLRNFLAIDNIA
ncbi:MULTISPECIES: TniQ family protein [Caballeronia]|uniref:TniQ family protein n=1 Tax=Caballeronia TaxID=1827195 RepID=UPI00025BAD60|nr:MULTISPECIES: TniQ family protein [Caballeronia]EKS70379.1 Tn7-like transposition protein D [Burkholderia sp. SJ98]MCE4546347.1 TniQ family protein [Caballeronia sp. PC1]MCE4573178.1 TniQ family protein [Caballeronia sp. CLC5]